LGLICILVANASAIESAYEWPIVASGRAIIELSESLEGDDIAQIPDELGQVLRDIGAYEIQAVAPQHQPGLYQISFDRRHSVEEAISNLRETGLILNAWPNVLVPYQELTYTPNDLLLPSQWHINQIDAPRAWGIFRGADTVQVGIIDGGVDYVHVDLAQNIWINPGEDLNGNRIIEPAEWDTLDSDGNGYVDDFWGWDWVNLDSSQVWPGEDPGPPDNDPSDFDGHGTHCAGDACAATDNAIGVAAPGFSCQIMALRAGYLGASGQGFVDLGAAIPAVYYAIDMGAEILSMSFGGSPYPPFQSALQAASDAGLVLVAAAGNESSSQPIYPAAYDFAIAVAATGPGDVLADFSNYGTWITVCAPGVNIMSTIPGAWGNMSGTSMATPVTAGVAALVKSLQPGWSSLQVGQWLAQTADNIDAQNPGYIGMMGGGRINTANAVDIYVTVDSLWTENDIGGSRLAYGQEGSLFVRYHKYIGNAANVVLTMSSQNPRASFSQAVHNIGTLLEGQSGDNSGNPFRLTVQQAGDPFETIELQANFTGDGFEFAQLLEIPVGRGQILIIDADQNQTKQTSVYYADALTEMGMSFETWKRSERDSLGTELDEYDAVIHFSGTAEANIFPGNDWTDLNSYLNGGGKLIVTGQNVAQDLSVSQPSVLQNTLRVEFLAPSSGILNVAGAPSNPLTAGMEMVMAGGGGAWNQNSMDKVGALLGAEPWFVYRTEVPTELAGVRTRIGQKDIFFCAFGIEGINDSLSAGATRYEVLSLMLEQFGILSVEPTVTPALPHEMALHPPFPNPFNSQQRISYYLPKSGPVAIAIFDVSGRKAAEFVNPNTAAGNGSWIWKAGPESGSGIYFIRLNAAGRTLLQKTVYMK
jgi:subtilisin family serine protease